MFKKKAKSQDHKFCPVCGTKLKITDTYCIKCGYSFAARAEKSKKLKKRNLWIIIALLIIAYFGLRYANGQTWIPTSIKDAVRTIIPLK